MKSVLKVMMTIVAICVTHVANAQELTFDKAEHDYGRVPERGGVVSAAFEFTNTGAAPLVVMGVTTTCSCAKIVYPRSPVAPGQKAEIRVNYDPKNQNGTFFKTVQVYSNDPRKRAIVTIKGEVVE